MKNFWSILKIVNKKVQYLSILLFFLILFLAIRCALLQCNRSLDLNNDQIIESFKGNKKSVVFLIVGQSNAANYGARLFSSEGKIFSYHKGKILKAKDPLPGASGKKGSIWIPFSEILLKNQIYDQILLVNIAEGSSTVSDWAVDGKYHNKLTYTLKQLQNTDMLPDFIIWQQGEEDNLLQTSFDIYKMKLQEIITIINGKTHKTSIVLSLTSYSPTAKNAINTDIRRAQGEVIQENLNVFLGPDTDIYTGRDFRYDGIHFSEAGMFKIAEDWGQKISSLTIN